MVSKDIIDTEKKTFAENLKELAVFFCIGFTIAMAASMVAAAAFAGNEASQGLSYCWMLLAMCASVSVMQMVFFTTAFIKRMTYPLRVALFGVCLFAVLCAMAFFLGWVPAEEPLAWVTFTVVYLVILALFTVFFTVKLSKEARKLNEGLTEYRRNNPKK